MSLVSGGFILGSELVLGDFLFPLPERVLRLVNEGQPVTLGMRQEAVSISTDANSTDETHLPALVTSSEADYVHRTQTVHLRTGAWSYSGVCALDVPLRIGQPVYAQLDTERLYFFDTKSGLRI